MSLRLHPRSNLDRPDEPVPFLNELMPWVEKLFQHPQGLGFIMIGAAALVRMTHTEPHDIIVPNPHADRPGEPPLVLKTVSGEGLDIVVWEGDLGAVGSVINAATSTPQFGQNLGNAVGQPVLGWFLSVLQMGHAQATQNGSTRVAVKLSDVLFFGGAALIGGSFLGSLGGIGGILK